MKRWIWTIGLAAWALAALTAQDKREWPRIMVIFDEKIDNQAADARLVASKIEEMFLEKGFRLVDKGQFEHVTARDVSLAEGNPARAKELGLRYGAELIIVGKSESRLEAEKEFYGMKNYEYQAKGDARVIITDTGELIAVSSKTAKKSAAGAASAADLSMKMLAENLSDDLYVKIRARLSQEQSGPRILQLVLLGIDDKQLAAYEDRLPREIPIIERLKLRYLEKDGAVLEATVNGTVEDLRAAFTKRDDLSVVSFTGTRLDVSTRDFVEKAKGSPMMTSPIDITGFTIENVFPSQVNYYAYNPLASIELENSAKAEVRNVKVSIFVPDYMTLPSEQIVPSIAAGAKQSFKLPATFDAKRLNDLSANATGQAKVEVSYTFSGQAQTRSLVKPVTIYSRNTISWKRGESVGSFVTSTDESVVNFSRYVVGSVAANDSLMSRLPRNVANALAVWSGIRAHGYAYVSSPWKPSEQDVLDLVSYPRETLASHTGNCSATSVLLASCLENLGIRTKFLATADHIYIMFDTDVLPKNGYMVSQDEKQYVVDENRVWIPLESTMINRPFMEAWKTAADEYAKSAGGAGKLEVIDTRRAQAAFPPANLAMAVRAVSPPDAGKITAYLVQELTEFDYAQHEMTTATAASLASSSDPAAKNKAAVIDAKAGQYDVAVSTIGALSTAQTENTLGNVALLKNDLPSAQEHYQKSLRMDSTDGGVYLNFGIARYLSGSPDDAVEAFQAAIARFDSRDKAFEVLGLEKLNEALGVRGAEASKRISKNDLFDLLNRSLANLPDKQARSTQAARVREKYKNEQNRFVFGGRRGVDPTQIASVKEFLYWKL